MLVVIGAVCLLVHFVTLMILFFWLPVPLLSDLCLNLQFICKFSWFILLLSSTTQKVSGTQNDLC